MLNVIIPCAGEGKRLGLPYPKEIHQISENIGLIDLTFRLLYPHREKISRVTITLTPQKHHLLTYLAKWRTVFPIVFCYFDERNFEWAGSILSAEHLFLEKNIVLLPDSKIEEWPGSSLVPIFDELLDHHYLAFGVIKDESDKIMQLGAVRLEESGVISAFCDKPKVNLERFNGFWGTFGFTKQAGRRVLEKMTSSIQRHPVEFGEEFGTKPVGFWLKSYRDLGVWDHIFNIQSDLARPPLKPEEIGGDVSLSLKESKF